jgi:hypothetical protein
MRHYLLSGGYALLLEFVGKLQDILLLSAEKGIIRCLNKVKKCCGWRL